MKEIIRRFLYTIWYILTRGLFILIICILIIITPFIYISIWISFNDMFEEMLDRIYNIEWFERKYLIK